MKCDICRQETKANVCKPCRKADDRNKRCVICKFYFPNYYFRDDSNPKAVCLACVPL